MLSKDRLKDYRDHPNNVQPYEIEELAITALKWKEAVEGLTPNGSEFVDDPKACSAYIRQVLHSPVTIVHRLNARIAALEAAGNRMMNCLLWSERTAERQAAIDEWRTLCQKS